MKEREEAGKPRLDVDEFIRTYTWVNAFLPDELGEVFDRFVSEEAVTLFPDDAAELYTSLASDADRHMRLMAATGVSNLAGVEPRITIALLAQLQADEEPGVARQARETADRLLKAAGAKQGDAEAGS